MVTDINERYKNIETAARSHRRDLFISVENNSLTVVDLVHEPETGTSPGSAAVDTLFRHLCSDVCGGTMRYALPAELSIPHDPLTIPEGTPVPFVMVDLSRHTTDVIHVTTYLHRQTALELRTETDPDRQNYLTGLGNAAHMIDTAIADRMSTSIVGYDGRQLTSALIVKRNPTISHKAHQLMLYAFVEEPTDEELMLHTKRMLAVRDARILRFFSSMRSCSTFISPLPFISGIQLYTKPVPAGQSPEKTSALLQYAASQYGQFEYRIDPVSSWIIRVLIPLAIRNMISKLSQLYQSPAFRDNQVP